jgi:hypothetical protein
MSGCEEDIERPGAGFAGELSTIVKVANSCVLYSPVRMLLLYIMC